MSVDDTAWERDGEGLGSAGGTPGVEEAPTEGRPRERDAMEAAGSASPLFKKGR